MNTRSRSFLTVITFLCLLAAGLAQQPQPKPRAAGKDLGEVPGAQIESAPGKQLFALLQANTTAPVVVLVGKSRLNENVTDYYRWFYDREQRHLVFLRRTEMRTMEDAFSWRIWHDISPEAFRDGLPYGNDKLRTTPSPFKGAKAAFPISYPNNPAIVVWP